MRSIATSQEGHTINNDLEPTNPLRHPVLAKFLSDEDTLDHEPDVLIRVLGALPKFLRDSTRDVDDGLERDRAGVALEVVPGEGILEVFKGCLIELLILLVGDILRFTVAQSGVIRIGTLKVTHRAQRGA